MKQLLFFLIVFYSLTAAAQRTLMDSDTSAVIATKHDLTTVGANILKNNLTANANHVQNFAGFQQAWNNLFGLYAKADKPDIYGQTNVFNHAGLFLGDTANSEGGLHLYSSVEYRTLGARDSSHVTLDGGNADIYTQTYDGAIATLSLRGQDATLRAAQTVSGNYQFASFGLSRNGYWNITTGQQTKKQTTVQADSLRIQLSAFEGTSGPPNRLTIDHAKFVFENVAGFSSDLTPYYQQLQIFMTFLPTADSETGAAEGGIPANQIYKTSTGELRIKL